MTTVTLYTWILYGYFKDNKCEFMNEQENEELWLNILEHIVIVGSVPRNILLNEEITNTNILFNLRELCKLQYHHLLKYHNTKDSQSKNCTCFLWQRYLNKIMIDDRGNGLFSDDHDKKIEKDPHKMHECRYILNAAFFVGILRTSLMLNNSLSIKNAISTGLISTEIINEVYYNNINIDGVTVQFYDTFDVDFEDNHHHHREWSHFHQKHRRLSEAGHSHSQNQHQMYHKIVQ